MANTYWVGGTSSTASEPTNWIPVGVPASTDILLFDNSATDDCDFDISDSEYRVYVFSDCAHNLFIRGVSSTCEIKRLSLSSAGVQVYPDVTLKFYDNVHVLSGASATARSSIQRVGATGAYTLELQAGTMTGIIEYCDISDGNLRVFQEADFQNCNLNLNEFVCASSTTIKNCDTFKITSLEPYDANCNLTLENIDVDMYNNRYWYFNNINPDDAFNITLTNSKYINFEPSIHYRTTGSGKFTHRLGFPEQLSLLKKTSSSKLLKQHPVGSPLPYIDVISGDEKVQFGCILSPNSQHRTTGLMRQIEERFDVVAFSWYDGMIQKGVLLGEPPKTYSPGDVREFRGEIGATL